MRISKRKIRRLERRVADLEQKVRSQQEEITSLKYPYEDVKQALEVSLCNQAGEERQQVFKETIRQNKKWQYLNIFILSIMLIVNLIYLFYQISIL